jgi:hypothetical protein
MARHCGLTRVFPYFLICALLVGGCDEDVTSKPQYWGGYVPGATYRLLVDVSYWEDGPCYPASWSTMLNDSYGKMVPAGTHIRLVRIERRYSMGAGHLFRIVGHFLDGPYAGRDVGLGGISTRIDKYNEDKGFRPNPAYIEVCP